MDEIETSKRRLRMTLDLWIKFKSDSRDSFDWQFDLHLENVIVPRLNDLVRAQFDAFNPDHKLGASQECEKEIIHYTSLDTLISILQRSAKKQTAYLRMYDSFHLNDPEEGKLFMRCLSQTKSSVSLPQEVNSHAYIASFIEPNDNKPVRDENNLQYWLAYGDHAKGCSIRFPVRHDRFSRVLYGKENVVRTLKNIEWKPIYDFMNEITRDLDHASQIKTHEKISETISKNFARLRFLYKVQPYDYEKECRLVIPSIDVADELVHFERVTSTALECAVRHYIESEDLLIDRVLVTGSFITLGPLVTRPDNIRYYLMNLLKKSGLSGPKVKFSKIPYQGR